MVRRQIEVPVSPSHLWELVADPASVSSWFGATVEWTLVPGGAARFTQGEGGDRAGRIETVAPERELRFRWWPEDDAEDCSDVALLIEPVDEGARLTVIEVRVGAPQAMQAPRAQTSAASWDPWDTRLAGVWCQLVLAGARAVA